jgi:hypothetical protein
MPPTLVSLHIPKTGGTTFLHCLREHYGRRLLLDYKDQPMRHGPLARPWIAARSRYRMRRRLHRADCVHGHFLAAKYAWTVPGANLVTWVREPVARLVSHYSYWKSETRRDLGPLHATLHRENWSLAQFAEVPRFWNLYSQYLWMVPLDRFACIGITETYAESLAEMCRRFGIEFREPEAAARASGSDRLLAEDMTPALRARIEQHNRRDLALYERIRSHGP